MLYPAELQAQKNRLAFKKTKNRTSESNARPFG